MPITGERDTFSSVDFFFFFFFFGFGFAWSEGEVEG